MAANEEEFGKTSWRCSLSICPDVYYSGGVIECSHFPSFLTLYVTAHKITTNTGQRETPSNENGLYVNRPTLLRICQTFITMGF